MRNHRILHKLTNLMHKESNVSLYESKILRNSHYTSISSRISIGNTVIFEKSVMRKAWTITRPGFKHFSFLYHILSQKQTICCPRNLNAQKIMQRAQIFDIELNSKELITCWMAATTLTVIIISLTYKTITTTSIPTCLINNEESEYVVLKPREGRKVVNLIPTKKEKGWTQK